MVDLNKFTTIDLLTDTIANTVSCDKYSDSVYSCVGGQLAGIPDAGVNYLFKTNGSSLETASNSLLNYYANPDPDWFPDPIPSGYISWGFLNLQGVQLIESNDDGTFKLVCQDCYAQAVPEEGSGNPPLDVPFPAEIYMDSSLNTDFDLSTFYTDGTILNTTKKQSDNIGDVTYSIDYNTYDDGVAYLSSVDTQLRATTPIGIYDIGGMYDLNCINPYCFVITYDTDVLYSQGQYLYVIYVYQEVEVTDGIVTQPQEKLPDRRYYMPSSNKGKISTITFGQTYKKSVKKSREITGKPRWKPYN